jgi:chromosomal replication initiator protein
MSNRVSIRAIQRATCQHFKIGRVDLLSKSRMAHLVEPRHIAIFLAREGGVSWMKLGREFNREHTVPIYAVRRIKQRIDAGDKRTLELIAAIKEAIVYRGITEAAK